VSSQEIDRKKFGGQLRIDNYELRIENWELGIGN
jgi:hypothetical protein